MLRKLHDLIGYTIDGTDESIGSVDDFYFDDHNWTVRYVVVDTGSWLLGRRVLISTEAITAIESIPETITLNLTKEQIENSPSIEEEQPISREHEVMLHNYYGWPGYWTVSPLVGMPLADPGVASTAVGTVPTSSGGEADINTVNREVGEHAGPESNLRSVREVTGYTLHANDGDLGHVKDIFAGENDWVIRYFMIDTRNWWPGKHVLVARDWVKEISWSDHSMSVNLTQQQVKDSPEYDPKMTVERNYEAKLHDYYLATGYWL